ncbi:RNA-binding S4 domain-containing protein [Sphaerotilus mobilis]|uniref:Heat shock protein Hsp15 n=1 Tax=Sphaerotilus mobilis TaxID=47994 RepID=A0A4Q7LQD8_9BURK|nr:RNA-binding S4 domain-containing protein [Sphaerotilus mobilis]RZS57056.1 heat shock protein Hsp15 [Sphaerotilus mobilis]
MKTHHATAQRAAESAKAQESAGVRLDKWLWAARFYKTRSVAGEAIEKGRVMVNEQLAKASRTVRVGDMLAVRQGDCPLARRILVKGVSDTRGPAPVAQLLYEETEESRCAIAAWTAARPYQADPAQSIEQGRPTKSDRRKLVEWQRWSVSLDDDAPQ